MALDDDIRMLERAPVIGSIGHDPLRLLAFSAERREYKLNDTIFEQGARADGGFVISRGDVLLTGEGVRERVVTPVALLGELALVCALTRPVTAIAQGRVQALFVPRSLFRRVLTEFPGIAINLREILLTKLESENASLSRVRATLEQLGDNTGLA